MDSYVGEIRLFAGNFAPAGWAFSDGSLLSIAEYSTLYSVLGTMYGGDGTTTFALPDLRGRVPVHVGPGYTQGEKGGAEAVTLTPANLPAHTHSVNVAADAAQLTDPEGAVLAAGSGISMYSTAAPALSMHPNAIGESIDPRTGTIYGTPSPEPHENMQPYQCLNYIICLDGIFPSRS